MLSSSMQKLRCPKGDRIYAGDDEGSLYDFSIQHDKIIRNYGQIFKTYVSSISTTIDKKTLFVCSGKGEFGEYDTESGERTNHFAEKNANQCLVTNDGRFLITAEYHVNI